MGVDAVNLHATVSVVSNWLKENKGRYICVANVHMCMECWDNPEFSRTLENADMVMPDGKPIALALQLLGQKQAEQVRGADLTREILKFAHSQKTIIGFYGSTETTLARIQENLNENYPGIEIGCMISPPFRPLSEAEIISYRQLIKKSGIQILFVGLGCPKQETWMEANVKHLNATMIGIGAVFEFMSGEKPMAPKWIRTIGMEWFFRLIIEPRRLWKRYASTNARFIWHFGRQFIHHCFNKPSV